jgi:hypothetical protein
MRWDEKKRIRRDFQMKIPKSARKLLISADFGPLCHFIIIHIMFLYKYRILNCAVFVNIPPPLPEKIGIPDRDAFSFL